MIFISGSKSRMSPGMIRYEDHENKGVTSAEFVEGQSSDALVSCSASEDADAKEQAHAIRKERKDIVKLALYRLLSA